MADKNIDRLEPGMIIGQDVSAPNGKLLLEAGTVLEDKSISYLKKQGVEYVDIQENKHHFEYSEEEYRRMKYEVEKRTRVLFSDCINDKYMQELFKVVCEIKFIEMIHG